MGAPQQQADADNAAASAFITRWQRIPASELSTEQSFVTQLCDELLTRLVALNARRAVEEKLGLVR